MNQAILHVALVVRDYDEAIAFFCEKLHFTLIEDTYLSRNRTSAGFWLAPPAPAGPPCSLPGIDARTGGFHRPADRGPRVSLPAD